VRRHSPEAILEQVDLLGCPDKTLLALVVRNSSKTIVYWKMIVVVAEDVEPSSGHYRVNSNGGKYSENLVCQWQRRLEAN